MPFTGARFSGLTERGDSAPILHATTDLTSEAPAPPGSSGQSARMSRRREPAVQVVGRADQRQVGERLREVPEVLRARAELLAVEADVVRVSEHLLHEVPRLEHVAFPRQA